MKTLLCVILSLPATVLAWDLVDPRRPERGAVSITTITDILAVNSGAFGSDSAPGENFTYWIAFNDADVVPICRAMGGIEEPLDSPNQLLATAYTYAGRFVVLETKQLNSTQFLLPIALFAQANSMRIRVKLKYENARCKVEWLQTCTGPNSCVVP